MFRKGKVQLRTCTRAYQSFSEQLKTETTGGTNPCGMETLTLQNNPFTLVLRTALTQPQCSIDQRVGLSLSLRSRPVPQCPIFVRVPKGLRHRYFLISSCTSLLYYILRPHYATGLIRFRSGPERVPAKNRMRGKTSGNGSGTRLTGVMTCTFAVIELSRFKDKHETALM